MELCVGQRFLVTSAIAQGYERLLGYSFSFMIEVYSLGEKKPAPLSKPDRDVTFRLLEWKPRGPYLRDDPWYAANCLTIGHNRYNNDTTLNYAPDQITGEGTWYLPDFFRWQHLFLYWWRHDVVELIDLEHIQGDNGCKETLEIFQYLRSIVISTGSSSAT